MPVAFCKSVFTSLTESSFHLEKILWSLLNAFNSDYSNTGFKGPRKVSSYFYSSALIINYFVYRDHGDFCGRSTWHAG